MTYEYHGMVFECDRVHHCKDGGTVLTNFIPCTPEGREQNRQELKTLAEKIAAEILEKRQEAAEMTA